MNGPPYPHDIRHMGTQSEAQLAVLRDGKSNLEWSDARYRRDQKGDATMADSSRMVTGKRQAGALESFSSGEQSVGNSQASGARSRDSYDGPSGGMEGGTGNGSFPMAPSSQQAEPHGGNPGRDSEAWHRARTSMGTGRSQLMEVQQQAQQQNRGKLEEQEEAGWHWEARARRQGPPCRRRRSMEVPSTAAVIGGPAVNEPGMLSRSDSWPPRRIPPSELVPLVVEVPDEWVGDSSLWKWARPGAVESALHPSGLMAARADLMEGHLNGRPR